jgi:hypothetical protein
MFASIFNFFQKSGVKTSVTFSDSATAEKVMSVLTSEQNLALAGVRAITLLYAGSGAKQLSLTKRFESARWIDSAQPVLESGELKGVCLKPLEKEKMAVAREAITHIAYYDDDGEGQRRRNEFALGKRKVLSASSKIASCETMQVLYKVDEKYYLLTQSPISKRHNLLDVSDIALDILTPLRKQSDAMEHNRH